MKKNFYYQVMLGRKNVIKGVLLTLFMGVSSGPRLLLECFLRKNLGERYYSLSLSVILIVVLAILPFSFAMFHPHSFYHEGSRFWATIGKNALWYIYLAVFFYMSLQRRKEIKRSKSSFDFGRYSKSNGDIHIMLETLWFQGERVSVRFIETVIEPGICLAIGLVLILFGQSVGFLITLCSLIYSLSYCAAYYQGDNAILDKIDDLIVQEEFVNFFIDGKGTTETRGIRKYHRTPTDPALRRKLMNAFSDGVNNVGEREFEEVK